MRGIYYQTLSRDEATGVTEFYVSPTEEVPFVCDGLVRCKGQIGIYAYRMPVYLTGTYQDGVFQVTSDQVPDETEHDMRMLLEYLADGELTEAQKNRILDAGNLFETAKQKNAVDVLVALQIKQNTAKRIIKNIRFLLEREKMTKTLMRQGIPLDRIERLIHKQINLDKLKLSPYLNFLFADIGIYHADAFAVTNCHMNPYAPQRLIGFVYDALMVSRNSGNSCISLPGLLRTIQYRMEKSVYPDAGFNMALLNFCLSEMGDRVTCYQHDNMIYVYETKIYQEETRLISDIERLSNSRTGACKSPDIREVEHTLGIQYTNGQKKCFEALKSSGIKIITGPPGSGKTAVIKGLIQCFQKEKKGKVKLAATTGRAAQVLGETCGMPAVTVNKMLDIRPFENAVPGKTASEPIQADLLIVDEVSMLGLELASFLFSAVQNKTILILVGDKDQLPSVEYGNVLDDLIQCGKIETFCLTEVLRQGGTILKNAQLINHGNTNLVCDPSFQIHSCTEEEAIRMVKARSQQADKLQFLSTIKKECLGIYQVNDMLQEKNRRRVLKYGKMEYFAGDRIIMTQTKYERGYFNGDIGTILRKEDAGILVQFQDKILLLEREDYLYMNLAYCVTIHKSQGSEFDEVHILLPDSVPGMLTRRLLYTAVTRAKQSVTIYSIGDALMHAIMNTEEKKRISLLPKRMQGLKH